MYKAKRRTLQLNAQLAQTLTEKGVEATADETTTTLVDKVKSISSLKDEQERTVEITENGITEIIPDENKVFSKVTVNTNVVDSYYDMFWDNVQQNGERTDYTKLFSSKSWNDVTFKPKYDLKPTNASQMFMYSGEIDLIKSLEDCGVILDTSKCVNFTDMFSISGITTCPFLDMSGVAGSQSLFNACEKLITIRQIKMPPLEKQTTSVEHPFFYLGFLYCQSLKDISFSEGSQIGTTITINKSPLTVESAKSIITHLANYAGTENEYTYSLILSTTTLALLEAEGNTAPDGGTWADYVNSLGWNM